MKVFTSDDFDFEYLAPNMFHKFMERLKTLRISKECKLESH